MTKKEQRQIKIKNILDEKGKMRIVELAKELNVTPETLRTDLNELESMHIIAREHGYARIVSIPFEGPLALRKIDNVEDKRKIMKRAIQEIEDGQVIYLDASSSIELGIPYLQSKKDITIITNSIVIANQCMQMDKNTFICGGQIYNPGARTFDQHAMDLINSMNIDVAFLGSDGIKDSNGFTTCHSNELSSYRSIINQSKKIIVVCDKSKFEKTSPFIFCKYHEVDKLITNHLTTKQKEKLENIEIIEV